MKHQKVQIAMLACVLAAVIALGGWLVLRTPGEKTPDEPPANSGGTTPVSTGSQLFDMFRFQPSTYRPLRQETEDDFSVDIVSMASDEVLRTYEAEEFYDGSFFTSLYVDQDDVLWAVYYAWETETTFLAPCKPGVEESDVIELKFGEFPSYFAAWNGCYALLSGEELCIVDAAPGEAEMVYTRQDIRSCSMDENGNLYFLTRNPDSSARGYSVTKYSLEQKMEYKDQIALRLMTGDVGDLVMVTGSGLGTETMTETDAFADLSAALDACPFRDELPDNLLDPLRGADGAIRGLPLGMLPTYYVWNQDLLEELGIDPYTVTWSQLLDLALEWQAQGTDLSLAVSEAGIGLYSTKGQLFQDILLANLYDAPQADGSVRLDQPYLRELLEKFKALYDSSRLIRYDGKVGRALLTGCYSNGNMGDRLGWLQIAAGKTGVRMRAAPCPLGEVSRKRQGYAFCWAVSQTSEHKDAARDFLLFLASGSAMTEETQYSYTQDTLPVNTAAQGRWREYRERIQWNGWGTTEEMREYFRQVQAAMDVSYVRFDQITGWYPAVAQPLAQYITGELTLDEAMGQANDNWERFLLE